LELDAAGGAPEARRHPGRGGGGPEPGPAAEL
jgi:hypothetical protein